MSREYWIEDTTDVSALVGRTLSSVSATDEEITFVCDDGARFRMDHSQDCCECVTVEDVSGDWADLIGTPILVAEERTDEHPDGTADPYHDSVTWTFYTLRTVKGSVDIRWCGSSNGYYSERVDFYQLTPDTQ